MDSTTSSTATKTIIVRHLPRHIDPVRIEAIFEAYGPLCDAYLPRNRDLHSRHYGTLRGFAVIRYVYAEGAQMALMHGPRYIYGKAVQIEMANGDRPHLAKMSATLTMSETSTKMSATSITSETLETLETTPQST